MTSKAPASKRTTDATQPVPPPAEDERRAIDEARGRLSSRPPRIRTKVDTAADKNLANIGPDHSDHAGWFARLQVAFGSRSADFTVVHVNHILSTFREPDGTYSAPKLNAAIALIEAAKPADELQAALTVQMAITHELALQAMRRAARVDQIPQYDSAGNMAVKLLRTVTMQMEALAKLQRGGEQVVRVVHVHAGAQAVIGTVQTRPEGGGSHEIEHQPHAPSASGERSTPLLRQEQTIGVPLPSPGGEGEASLPDARRGAG